MVRAVSNRIEIDGLKLPPAPQTLIQLIEVCHRDEIDFDELHRIVSRDAALVSRILSVAHSAAYSQWRDVSDLRRLMVVLGIDTVRSLALTAAVAQFFAAFDAARGVTLGQLWMDGLICAQLCRRLAGLTGYPQPDMAWMAGLLHRCGQLVLLDNDPDDYPKRLEQAADIHHLLELERKHYGIDSCEIGAHLISQWGELDLADALRFQYHPAASMRDCQALVKLLNRAAQWTLRHRDGERAVLEDGLFDLQQDLLLDLLTEAVQNAMADARSFSIDTDASTHYPLEGLDNEAIRLKLAGHIQNLSLAEAGENGLALPREPEQLLQQLQQNLRILLGLPNSLTFLPDADDPSLLRGVEPVVREIHIRLQAGRSRVANCALRIDEPLSQDAEPAVIDLQLCERLGRPDFFCLPLLADGQLQALLLVGFNEHERPRLEERRGVLEQLARRVALLIRHQQRLQQEQQQMLEQQRLEIEYRSRELAHEIKNPLTTIRNYLELLSEQVRDSDAQPHLETIKSEIDRVGKLLRQLRDPQAHSNGHEIQVDVNQLITELLALYRPELEAVHEIHSDLDLDPQLEPQPIDRNRLKQVIVNLIKNAAEALSPGGHLRVRTRSLVIADGRKHFEIAIADDGPGIDNEILPQLFSPVATTKGPEHAGLGLSIVQRLLQEMDGSIRYGRSDLGGAEFTLMLPLANAAADQSTPTDG